MRVLQCKVTPLYFTPAYCEASLCVCEASSCVCAAVGVCVLQCVAVCAAVCVTMRVLQCKVAERCPTLLTLKRAHGSVVQCVAVYVAVCAVGVSQ